jgi:hypothetical protein
MPQILFFIADYDDILVLVQWPFWLDILSRLRGSLSPETEANARWLTCSVTHWLPMMSHGDAELRLSLIGTSLSGLGCGLENYGLIIGI